MTRKFLGMNKVDLIGRMAASAGISHDDANSIIDAFRKIMVDALKTKKEVSLSDFGPLMVVSKAELIGRGTRSGAPLLIREANVLGRQRN